MSVSITAPLAAAANPAAALNSGGSLTVSTTYYYKIVALKEGLYGSLTGPYSAGTWGIPCAEVSATPTSGNQTIDLTWDAVAGATGYEVYRTEASGDYDSGAAHLLSDPGTREDYYASTVTNSFSDDGAQEITECVYLEHGMPMAVLTGSTEGSPDDEDDIYAALIAGGYTNHASRVKDLVSSEYFQYYFLCNINIQGWLKFNKGKQIYHIGTLTFLNGATGGLTLGVQSTRPKQGAVYFRKFIYTAGKAYSTNVIKIYNSYIKDLTMDYKSSALICYPWKIDYNGEIYAENSIIELRGFIVGDNSQGNLKDSFIAVSMLSSFKLFIDNCQITYNEYAAIYCYYATQNAVFKNITTKDIPKDIRFHKNGTAIYFDAINHTWKNDPPSASATNNPANLTVRRKYEVDLQILGVNNTKLSGAAIKFTDNLSNEISAENSDSNGLVYIASGTATSGGSDTITDTGKSWAVNALADLLIEIYDGTGEGQWKSILSNTVTIITVKGDWETQPDNTSKYRIRVLLQSHTYAGKAAIPYYDTIAYNPITLVVKKSGYKKYTKKFTVTTAIDWQIIMQRIDTTIDQEAIS